MTGYARRRGVPLILSSPSGAGKTTLARGLLESEPDTVLSVSCTTRAPRAGEVEGRDYYFVDEARFDALTAAGDLLEWAHVYAHRYGTPREPVERWLAQGRDVLFDVDWQGARQIRERMREPVASVFVLPPSLDALAARLRARGKDTEEVIARRMRVAAAEIAHWDEYDYILVNDDLSACAGRLKAILLAERIRRARRVGMAGFVAAMIEGHERAEP